ncbi:MAG TPA: HAMP domain-containing sensor histidine kinase [Terriglobia bacterium]
MSEPESTSSALLATAEESSTGVSPDWAPVGVLAGKASVVDATPGYPELLERFRRLQKESQRKGTALGTAAHQLKTPLAIVAGYVDLLLTEKPGPLNDRQRRILEESSSNCSRLHKFIEEFLCYSALDNGRPLRFNVADLCDCLSELHQYWLSSFRKKGVNLYLPLKKEELRPFPFDYDKIQHAVSNLLENALKFTPPGGAVWLAAEPYRWERRNAQQPRVRDERRKRSSAEPNAVRVSVSDTGPGVAPEYRQEIFEDFVTLSEPGENHDGLGLGLAIARRMVLAHGGKLWVEGEMGEGSTFCFFLPLNPSPAPAENRGDGTGQ